MKWFKHISDSLDDPFIFDLMTEFKSDGYVVFFGIIEIYSREFLKENDWKLVISLSFLHQKLRISPSKIKNILLKIDKWKVSFEGSQVSIFIPKFTELMDEWTMRKIGSKSGVTPKILSHEVDKEEDIRIKNKNKDTDRHRSPEIGADVLSGDKSPSSCPHKEIIELYHEILPELSQVKEWTEERQKFLRTRWKEKNQRQSLEWWKNFFQDVKNSDYLTGKVNGFKADLEWLIRPKNFLKVLEGRYLNREFNPEKEKWF